MCDRGSFWLSPDGDDLASRKESVFKSFHVPQASPDGKLMAFRSMSPGERGEVYIRPFDASRAKRGGKWQVSKDGSCDVAMAR